MALYPSGQIRCSKCRYLIIVSNHGGYRKCGSHISEEALIAAEEHFRTHAISKAAFDNITSNAANTTIPVYFHIITNNLTMGEGDVS